VRAESAGEGQGSEFLVTLPMVPALRPALPGAGDAALAARNTHRVLVVDDNVDACESIAMILETFGYSTRCLYDGPSVLPAAQQWQPDAIVLDIGLPGMSGLEVAAQLRQQPAFARLPLIALTGYGQEEDRRRSREAGFDLHLTKPVEPAKLLELLADVLAHAAA
jgi:two-component system CheB/CheR fusion protein